MSFLLIPYLLLSLILPCSSQLQAGFIALGGGQDNNWDYKVSCFPFSSFQILYLSAANINTDGSVGLRFDNDPQHIPQIVAKAHNVGARALLSIGGPAGYPSFSFANAIKNPANFIKSLVGLQTKFDLDGFDLDWEDNPNDQDIQLIRNSFRAEQGLSHAMITLDVYGGSGLSSETLTGFDYINVMNYGNGASLVNEDVDSAARAFQGRVSVEKLLIGVNFEAYGDDASERKEVTNDLITAVGTFNSGNAGGVFSWNSFDDSGASNKACVWSGTQEIEKKMKS